MIDYSNRTLNKFKFKKFDYSKKRNKILSPNAEIEQDLDTEFFGNTSKTKTVFDPVHTRQLKDDLHFINLKDLLKKKKMEKPNPETKSNFYKSKYAFIDPFKSYSKFNITKNSKLANTFSKFRNEGSTATVSSDGFKTVRMGNSTQHKFFSKEKQNIDTVSKYYNIR